MGRSAWELAAVLEDEREDGAAPDNILTGQYSQLDANMDGTVRYTGSSYDRDPILVKVRSTTTNNSRVEFVP